jgi:hypothetical protein
VLLNFEHALEECSIAETLKHVPEDCGISDTSKLAPK